MEKKQYKIWWQSSTKIDLLPGYKEAVEAHAKKILGDQFLVEMHGVETSPNATQWSYFEMLNSRDMMENFFRAQEEGFDCIAIGCFSDPCLQEAREALDIPVVSIAENAIAWARMYGASACIVTTDEVITTKKLAALIKEYGAENFAKVERCLMSLETMAKALSEPEDAMKAYSAVCEQAAREGAEVIIPGCGLLSVLSTQNHYCQVGDTGAIVLDVTGALMKMAEAAIILRERSGLMTSRRGKYRKPDDAQIERVRRSYGLIK